MSNAEKMFAEIGYKKSVNEDNDIIYTSNKNQLIKTNGSNGVSIVKDTKRDKMKTIFFLSNFSIYEIKNPYGINIIIFPMTFLKNIVLKIR